MTELPNNLWKSPVIKNRLAMEAAFECSHGISEKAHYWVLVPVADSLDGTITLKNYEKNLQNTDPHELQQEFAKEIHRELQDNAHFDGLWLVGFTHPPTTYGVITDTENCWGRLIAIWHDEDGDPKYTVESDFQFKRMIDSGSAYYVGLAQQAHDQYQELYSNKSIKEDMQLTEGQQTKAALEALN